MSNLNITIRKGITFTRNVKVSGEDGSLTDLTGIVIKGQIRSNLKELRPLAEFTFTLLNQTTNTGEFFWTLPVAGITKDVFEPVSAKYNVEMHAVDGSVTELFYGTCDVLPDITK